MTERIEPLLADGPRTHRGPRPGPARGDGWASRPFLMALAMHLLLFLMLFIGVHWQKQEPVAVQAELWSPAAPVSAPVEPPPQTQPRPAPKPEPPRPVETPETPRAERPEAPREDPDLALQQRRERERLARERAEQEARKLAEAKKAEEARKLAEAKKAEEARKLAEARKAEETRKAAEIRKAAEAKKSEESKKAEEARKLAEAKKVAEAKKAAEAAEARRADHVKRLLAQAGTGEGSPAGSSGAAAGAARGATSGGAAGSADGSYAAKLSSLIRSNTVFQIPSAMQGNPRAEFQVTVMPDCSITAVRLRRSSGLPAWDQAAERAIQRSSPLPRLPDGKCPSDLMIAHAPREEH